jgi:hypothetical protein
VTRLIATAGAIVRYELELLVRDPVWIATVIVLLLCLWLAP